MTDSKPRVLLSQEERERVNAAMARIGAELRERLNAASKQAAAVIARMRGES